MFTLTGTLTDHRNDPLAAREVLVLPSPRMTVDADGDVVHLGHATVTTDEAGTFTVDLITAPGLVYTVRSPSGGPLRPVRFAAPQDGATVDLADVTPPDPTTTLPPPSVTADRGVITLTGA